MHLKNPDLDMKNPLEVWILWIHDPFLDFSNKMQNPFSDSRIQIWIPPPPPHQRKKSTLRLGPDAVLRIQ